MGLYGELRDGMRGDAHWGRILAIESQTWRRVRVRMEIHDTDQVLERSVTSVVPPRIAMPEVGQRVYVAQASGEFSGVEVPYRIHWRKQPQFGTPPTTPAQQRATEAAIVETLLERSSPATDPTDPLWQLEYITKQHDAGKMSDADFERYREALRPYL